MVLVYTLVLLLSLSTIDGFSFTKSSVLDKEKHSQRWDLFQRMRVNFMHQYREDKKNELSVLDAAMSGFTEAVKEALPSEVNTFGVEDSRTTIAANIYFCTNFAKLRDLKTIKKIDKNKHSHYKDSRDITVYYTVEEMEINYGTFYFQCDLPTTKILPTFMQGAQMKSMSGKLSLKFKKPRIAVKLNIPNFTTAMKALTSKTEKMCLIYVKKFEWENLGDFEMKIETDSRLGSFNILESMVNKYLKDNYKLLLDQMTKQVLMTIYNTLPKKPVCRHDEVKEQASTYGADQSIEYTKEYKERCGKQWQSTKNP